MAPTSFRRILVALEPAVLEGALAVLLEGVRGNDVVQFHQASEAERAGPFDAAVVTRDLVADVRAGVVITLPDGTEVAGVGVVARGDVRREVELRSRRQVIDLLDGFELTLTSVEHSASAGA